MLISIEQARTSISTQATLAWRNLKEFAAFVATMSINKYEKQLLEKC